MKYLFIGGCADGRWMEVPEDVSQLKVRDYHLTVTIPRTSSNFIDELYERRQIVGHDLQGESRFFDVFCLTSLTGSTLMQMLIEGYTGRAVKSPARESSPAAEQVSLSQEQKPRPDGD